LGGKVLKEENHINFENLRLRMEPIWGAKRAIWRLKIPIFGMLFLMIQDVNLVRPPTHPTHIASYKKPRSVVFTSEFPRSPVGKVLKKDLRVKYGKKEVSDSAPIPMMV